mmetsp:Transcript_30916/g.68272  ORF Transcript_30916/g.68272 Transcript_30916/m.68272 type:complete len:247 (-) Transcript_30916:300-1040(-)
MRATPHQVYQPGQQLVRMYVGLELLPHGDPASYFESLHGCIPGQQVALVSSEGAGLVVEGPEEVRSEFLLVSECETVGELLEELVGGVFGYHHPLAHRQCLHDGGAQHLAEGGVDEHLVLREQAVVLSSVEGHLQSALLGLCLYLPRVRALSVYVHVQVLCSALLHVVHQVEQFSQPLGPHQLAHKVGPLGELARRSSVSDLEVFGSHPVHVGHYLFLYCELLQRRGELDDLVAVGATHALVHVVQ